MTPAAESQLAWSPDSRRLVYSSERDGAARLVSYDFTTTSETPLTSAAAGDYAPQFSPDGKSVAFVRVGTGIQRGEYLLAIDGETIGRQVNVDALLDKPERGLTPRCQSGV